MARPRTLKLSDSDFKLWLLNHFIGENGEKVSFTDVLNSQEFIDETGLCRVNKETKEIEPASRGTLSYWCYGLPKKPINKYGVVNSEPFKGRGLTDDVIYQYGVQEGLIKDIEFEDWRNTYNKNSFNTHRDKANLIASEKVILKKIGKYLKSFPTLEDFDGDVEFFREYLMDYFGVDRYKEALDSIGGGK